MQTALKAVSGALVASEGYGVDSAQLGDDKSVIKPLSNGVAVGLRVVLVFG